MKSQLQRINNYISKKSTLELLQEYIPSTEEIQFKNDMLEFLKTSNAYERSNTDGHFTGSAFISTLDGTRALITHHKKLKMKLQLGGHADGDTDILRVAIKESLEESGISSISFIPKIFDIDIHTIPQYKDVKEHKHYDIRFLVIVDNDSEFKISDESDNLEWIDKNYNCDNSTFGFQRLFNKWRSLDFSSNEFQSQIETF